MLTSESIARWRVPVGWLLGLLALWLAEPTGGYLLAGVSLAAFGEALRLWASGYLDKDRRLATGGPYAWTRNPLYLGSLFVGLGFTLATGRMFLLFALVALFAAVYFPVMKREAARLEAAFPGDYSLYASRVPLLVPRVPRRDSARGSSFSWNQVWVNREPVTVVGLVLVVAILWAKWKLASP
jgi:protein-S-isoprenylcysteine O-methyltransferase Ste14